MRHSKVGETDQTQHDETSQEIQCVAFAQIWCKCFTGRYLLVSFCHHGFQSVCVLIHFRLFYIVFARVAEYQLHIIHKVLHRRVPPVGALVIAGASTCCFGWVLRGSVDAR
jgi:hypothetical protein